MVAPRSIGGTQTALPTLDKYELLEEIGHGGMATVYRARDKRLGREVAVKIIHKHLRENVEVASRFVAEARAAAKLRHPSIIEVYDVSDDDERERFLVAELMMGSTLRTVLERHRDMPTEVGAAIVLELCDAVSHAHAAGIVHRDVKPENVLVECPADRAAARSGERTSSPAPKSDRPEPSSAGRAARRGVVIKLTDFGIAKSLDTQGMTCTGQVLGSPAHMAPEQIEGGAIDVRTDVFALGVLLYECLVGHLPFTGKNPAQVLRRVLDGIYEPADRERPAVGARWARIIADALASDPEQRTPSAEHLAGRIRDELTALGVDDPPGLVDAYFEDPASLTAELQGRLVGRLVARSEQARARGDIAGAAADCNRALALDPDNPALLRQVAGMTRRASRRVLWRRLGVLAGCSALLGVSAFVVIRVMRPAPVLGETPAPDRPAPTIQPHLRPAIVEPSEIASAEPAGTSERPRTLRPKIHFTRPPASAEVQQGQRRVRFSLLPSGAKLTVDGQLRDWFGQTLALPVGAHSVSAEVPGSKCCRKYVSTANVTAAPEDKPNDVQVFVIKLESLPGQVSLVGAPDRASVTCSELGLTLFAGGAQSVKLPDAQWDGACFFQNADGTERGSRKVTLRAGEANSISW